MVNKILTTRTAGFILLLLSSATFAATAQAVEPIVWRTNSRAELLKGEARGVSITDTGALMLSPRLTQLYNTGEAYVWSSAVDGAGNVYLGTGHDGRIYRVTADGRGAVAAIKRLAWFDKFRAVPAGAICDGEAGDAGGV